MPQADAVVMEYVDDFAWIQTFLYALVIFNIFVKLSKIIKLTNL